MRRPNLLPTVSAAIGIFFYFSNILPSFSGYYATQSRIINILYQAERGTPTSRPAWVK